MSNPPNGTTSQSVHVLLIEDHQILREGLAALLGGVAGIEVVGQAATAAEANELLAANRADVAIIDVSLGDDDGIVLAAEYTKRADAPRVVILTMYDDAATVDRALQAGAGAYVLKGGGVAALAEAVFAVAGGGVWLDPKLPGRHDGAGLPNPDPLSAREIAVLKLVANGFTSAEIATKLGLATKTVQNHRARIMDKLGIATTVGLVRYALRTGLG